MALTFAPFAATCGITRKEDGKIDDGMERSNCDVARKTKTAGTREEINRYEEKRKDAPIRGSRQSFWAS
jgi:hypothetical protein